MTIDEVKRLRESEDKVEFKEALAQYNYNNGRRSVLGYIVALANEGGGKLILGVRENKQGLHFITGSAAWLGQEGKLKEDIYRDKQIRVETEVLFEGLNRVLIIHIPSRPVGKTLKFEDVPLMRVGEDLHPMSDEQLFKILQEQEPDFSAKICPGLTFHDLDREAVFIMQERYAEKQKNKQFVTLPPVQALSDLSLYKDGQLNYAALILLGKREKIKELLPQCAINLESRDNPDKIQFDKREIFVGPYFKLIDDLWKMIDARNKYKHVQIQSHIIDIPELNDEVIRESINNAIAHRDYHRSSEIIIKQSPGKFVISSHGGFPLGVTQENILTVNSTPRNRLLAEILTSTGYVERAGQGIDKIYYQNLSEGKDFPDFSSSDIFQITLTIPTTIIHPAFAIFVRNIQKPLSDEEKLGVFDIITLVQIRDKKELSYPNRIEKLKSVDAIRQTGDHILLGNQYSELIVGLEGTDKTKIINLIKENGFVKMGEIIALFNERLTRRQVNNIVFKLVKEKVLTPRGTGSATEYGISSDKS